MDLSHDQGMTWLDIGAAETFDAVDSTHASHSTTYALCFDNGILAVDDASVKVCGSDREAWLPLSTLILLPNMYWLGGALVSSAAVIRAERSAHLELVPENADAKSPHLLQQRS